MGSTELFQLTFTFIYSIFNKKVFNFSKISKSQTDSQCTQNFEEYIEFCIYIVYNYVY